MLTVLAGCNQPTTPVQVCLGGIKAVGEALHQRFGEEGNFIAPDAYASVSKRYSVPDADYYNQASGSAQDISSCVDYGLSKVTATTLLSLVKQPSGEASLQDVPLCYAAAIETSREIDKKSGYLSSNAGAKLGKDIADAQIILSTFLKVPIEKEWAKAAAKQLVFSDAKGDMWKNWLSGCDHLGVGLRSLIN